MLTSCWDGTARLWEVPEPLPNEPKRIKLWVETMTGLSSEAGESSELLKAGPWRDRKTELNQLGGPMVAITP